MLSIGVDRLELAIWKLGELDLLVIIHPTLGGRHGQFRIAAVEPEVGPQGCADKSRAADVHNLGFKKVDVGILMELPRAQVFHSNECRADRSPGFGVRSLISSGRSRGLGPRQGATLK